MKTQHLDINHLRFVLVCATEHVYTLEMFFIYMVQLLHRCYWVG